MRQQLAPEFKQTIAAADGVITYQTMGNPANPPLIFIHGWLSHSGVWTETMTALADTFYCVAVDLLGHGDSDKPSCGDYSISAQAGRVLAVADALGFERFGVIGHSMGGQISAYLAALLAPERIAVLVSVSGVVMGQLSRYMQHVIQPIMAGAMIMPFAWDVSRLAMRWRWYSYLFDYPLYKHIPAIPIEHLDRRMALQPGIETAAYRDLLAIESLDLTPHLRHIRGPVLVIHGCDDNTVPVRNGMVLGEHVPNAEIALMHAIGHVPMQEDFDSYMGHLRGFLTTAHWA